MQAANTMFFKVVPQKTGAFNILCGFNTKLVFATAERITSAAHTITTAAVLAIVSAHARDLNGASVRDCTVDAVLKKLMKNDTGNKVSEKGNKTFEELGIAQYL